MPNKRRHHDDRRDSQGKKPKAQVQQAPRQAGSAQMVAEETVWENSLGDQAEMLANPQFLTAQRSSLAVQIGRVQGNRHLGQVISAAGLNSQPFGRNGTVVQRQDTPATTHPTIRLGSSGADVVEAQTKLNTAGANPPLAMDGIFGPLTRAAVMEFQGSKNLWRDGVVGPKTWGELDQVGPSPVVPPERWSDEDRARLATQTSGTGPLTAYQASRAELRVYALSESENGTFRSLLDQAGSDMEWAYLLKAAAAQRSMDDITAFAVRIRGMSARWLMRNLMVVDLSNDTDPTADPEEKGITQQYGNSCGPTSMQLIHAQADPIYALELRSAGPIDQTPGKAASSPDSVTNKKLADEQALILGVHSAEGQGGGPAEDRDLSPGTTSKGGAWVESDMNALANATGVTYTKQIIGEGITQDEAISALKDGLASGVQVPLLVGRATKSADHYVVALAASGDRILIHDVYTGDTIWRTEAQFRSNTLKLPSSHNFFVGLDVPTLVPPPLPQPPAPAGG